MKEEEEEMVRKQQDLIQPLKLKVDRETGETNGLTPPWGDVKGGGS